MKKFLFLSLILFSVVALAASDPTYFNDLLVGSSLKVGGTGFANSKSAIEINSTTKGFLPSRMSTTQRDAISSPPAGLFLYNSTSNLPDYYNGTVWRELASVEGTETFTNKTLTSPIANQILFTEIATPSTPASGKLAVYAKADHKLYRKTSTGAEVEIGGGAGTGALFANGSGASPITITAAGGITPAGEQRELFYVASASGEVTVTANPQVVAGTTVGQELVIFGTSASNYIILSDGNGLSLNGPIKLTDNAAITLIWNGSIWSELSRR